MGDVNDGRWMESIYRVFCEYNLWFALVQHADKFVSIGKSVKVHYTRHHIESVWNANVGTSVVFGVLLVCRQQPNQRNNNNNECEKKSKWKPLRTSAGSLAATATKPIRFHFIEHTDKRTYTSADAHLARDPVSRTASISIWTECRYMDIRSMLSFTFIYASIWSLTFTNRIKYTRYQQTAQTIESGCVCACQNRKHSREFSDMFIASLCTDQRNDGRWSIDHVRKGLSLFICQWGECEE